MSAGRYRGWFSSPEGDPIPGTLEISDSGSLYVETEGRLFEKRDGLRLGRAALIEGEIEDSPFPGAVVTLFNCLQTKARTRFGRGGSWEQWLAHRALIGPAVVGLDAEFERVTLGIRGLGAFIGTSPPFIDPERKVIQPLERWTETQRLTAGSWRIAFGWETTTQKGATSFRLEQTPLIKVELGRPLSVEEILGEVVPVFETILTIAQQVHARVENITVSPSWEEAYRVLGPRVEALGEPRGSEPLFHLADMSGGGILIERVRGLFSQHRELIDIFLGYERVPPRYMEEKVRASVLTLAHLTTTFPGASDRARDWLSALESAPEQVRAFLPSAALVAVPEFVRELLTPSLCGALGVSSRDDFVRGIGPLFRWVTLREGTQASGNELQRYDRQLRALVHLSLLRLLGFGPEDAERRMVQDMQRRGISW